MQIQTKYFGTIEIKPETIIQMIQPIYGFEDDKRFTLITDEEIGTDLVWFQSVDHQDVCFILANPNRFVQDTRIEVTDEYASLIDSNNAQELDVLCIVSLGETFEQSTLNMKSPIVLNSSNNQGAQIILTQDLPFKARMVM